MSKLIDERVVEMSFDNKDFEKNVSTSMSTIDKLKNALNFKGAAKGLDSVSAAAKSVNMSNLEKSIDSVKVKFDALQIAGVTALANITNAVIQTGRNMVSSFTIDPITDGFSEYELQLNSIQTIMANTASKGTTIEQVTDALNELNSYADKTIYNFSEMTRNIGTFTAAGVDLETSVSAIQGIANLAAMSGSSSAQAAGAMYQLSQALAAGRVSLMDWNSVVTAGMGGEQFQNALKRTARNMGIAVDDIIAKYGSFRDSLTEGQWLTTDVLTETLKQLSGAYTEADLMAQGYSQDQAREIVNMASTAEEAATKVKTFTQLIGTMKEAVGSGWAQTWQAVFGDFYEARDFWTSISDWMGRIIGDASDARNALFEGAFASGWEQLQDRIEATGHSFDEFQNYVIDFGNKAGLPMQDLIDKAGGLGEAFQNGSISTDIAVAALSQWGVEAENADQRSQALNETFEDFKNTVKGIWTEGKFDEAPDRLNELSRAGYDFVEVGDLVKKIANGQEVAFESLTDEQLRAIGATDQQLTSLVDLRNQLMDTGSEMNRIMDLIGKPSGRELFFSSIKNAIDIVLKPMQAFTKAFHNVFAISPMDIYNILEGFNHFTQSLIIGDETAQKLTRTFEGIFSIAKIVTSFIGGGFSAAFKIVQAVLDELDIGFLDLTAGVGDFLVSAAEFVDQNNVVNFAVQSAADMIVFLIGRFQELVKVIQDSEVTSFIIDTIVNAFNKMVSAAQDLGRGLGDLFGNFMNALSNLKDLSFEDVMNIVKDFVTEAVSMIQTGITNMVSPFIDGFSSIVDFVTTNVPVVAQAIEYFGEMISEVFGNVVEWANRIGPGGILAVIFSIGMISLVKKIASAIEALKNPIQSLTDVIEGIGGSVENYFNAKAFKTKTEGFRNIGITIGIVAAAMIALAQLSPDQLFRSAAAVVAISLALSLVAAALTALGKVGFDKVGFGFAGIGAAIALVASAFATLSDIDQGSINSSLAVILTVMGAMTLLAIALRKFGGSGGKSGGNDVVSALDTSAVQILAIAAAVRIVADAFVKLSTVDSSGMQNAILGMITVLGSVLALTAIMSKFGGGLKGGLGLIAVVIGIQGVIAVLFELANLDTSAIVAGLPNIIIIFGLLTGLMAATSLAGGNAAKAGIGILAISAALMLISKSIEMLGNMDTGTMDQGLKAITKLLVIFTIIIAATNLAGKNAVKAGASLLLMSGAILVISLAISLLSTLDPSGLDSATEAVSKLLLMFAIIVGASGYSNDASKTAIALSVTIAILAGSVALLSGLDPAKVENATLCMISLMGAFAIMEAATSKVGKISSGMVALMAVVVVLAGIIAAVAGLAPESAISAAASIGLLLMTMSASIMMLGNVKMVSTSAVATLGVLTGVVAALAVIMGALSALNVEPSIETASSLSILLLTMTGITAALALMGAGGPGSIAAAATGAGALLTVVSIVGTFMVALGALNTYVPQVQQFVDSGIPLLTSIGTAIGSFFGGIVGGFASGASSNLPEIATALSQFALNLTPFIVTMSTMGDGALSGIDTIVNMFAKITGSNMLESLNRFFGGGDSMANFASNLSAFGSAIAAFSESISGKIDGDAVVAAANAGKALAEMQSMIQGEGGILQMFTGTKDLGSFSEQMKTFGEAIVGFSQEVSGNIDADAVTAAANAGKVMAELQKSIGTSGTSLSTLVAGTKDLGDFGGQLETFGDAIVSFSKTVSGEGAIDGTAVQNAANAGKIMAELQKSIDPTNESVISFFKGQSNLGTFGEQISAFGSAMVDFSNSVTENGGIDTDAITSVATVGQTLSNLASSLPEDGILDNKLNLSEFGGQITQFVAKIVSANNTVGDADFTNISNAANAATSIQQLLSNLQGIDESVINKFWVLDNLGTDLTAFSNSIAGVDLDSINVAITATNRIVSLIQSMSGVSGESVAGFSAAVSSLGQISYSSITQSFANVDFTSIGTNMVTSIILGFQNGITALNAGITSALTSVVASIVSYAGIFTTQGRALGTAFSVGISGSAPTAMVAATTLVMAAVSGLNVSYYSFWSAGYNLALGFASGISSGTFAAQIAAIAMANAAAEAAKAALDIQSPSRVMMEIGEYTGQGFVKGISGYMDTTYSTGRSIAESFVSGVSNVGEMLDQEGKLSSISESFKKLSESLTKTKEENGKKSEENAKKESKLADALNTLTDSIDAVISRKNDLKSFNEILSRVGDSFSEQFVAELLNSTGAYAGALKEMEDLTDEQIKDISYAFDQQKISEGLNIITDSLSESITEIANRKEDFSAMEKMFSEAGLVFDTDFVSEILRSSGSYAGALREMSNLTVEQIRKIEDVFSSKKTLEGFNTLADTIADSITSMSDRQKDLEAMQDIFSRTGLSLSNDFVKELVDSSGQYAGVIDEMAKLTDEQITSIAETFDHVKVYERINEITDSIIDNDGLAQALDYCGINIEEFAKKLDNFGISADEVTSAITDMADSVSDGFSKLSAEDQTGLLEFTDNLRNNIIQAETYQNNLERLFSTLGDYAYADKFREALIEGGYDQYGRIVQELAQKDREEIIKFLELFNTADIYGQMIGANIVNAVAPSIDSMSGIGYNLAQGMTEGMNSGTNSVVDSAKSLCDSVTGSITTYFGINSPSRLMAELAGYMMQGLVNGLGDKETVVIDAVRSLSDKIKQTFESISQETFTVKVTVDISNVTGMGNVTSRIQNVIGGMNSPATLSQLNAASVAIGQNGLSNNYKLAESVDNLASKIDAIDPDNFGTTFNQYNNSPKALSTATIYRQTKNQISLARSRVNKNSKKQ